MQLIEHLKNKEKQLLQDFKLLHFKEIKDNQKLTLYDFIKKIIHDYRNNYNTYEVGNDDVIQCGRQRRRSIVDIFLICKHYYPEVTLIEVIEEIYYNRWTENNIAGNYCGDVRRIVYMQASDELANNDSKTDCSVLEVSRYQLTSIFTLEFINKSKAERNAAKLKKEMEQKAAERKAKSAIATNKGFSIQVRTRHKTHFALRNLLPKLTFRSVFRLGSVTELDDTIEKGGKRVEINSTQGVQNSSSKKLMKECFLNANIKTADWFIYDTERQTFIQRKFEEDVVVNKQSLPFPLIAKSLFGSRGEGNTLIKDVNSLNTFMNRNLSNYIFEKYYTYSREYRLHVTSDGCFYTCRKMLKKDTPEEKRFQRHDDNCVWIVEENPLFDKPTTWNLIVEDCIKALNALDLDIAAFDVKVQSTLTSKQKKRENPEWIIIESCSAPSFGDITLQKYVEEIPKVATSKAIDCGII